MNARTRILIFGILLAVGILAIAAAIIATILYPKDAPGVLRVAVVVLVLALIGEILLLVLGRAKKFDEEGEWRDWEEETKAASQELLLRCTTCGNTFPIQDTGQRPLRHACPHCGRVGVLRDAPAAAEAANEPPDERAGDPASPGP